MGGKSVEREVSFNSGRTICDHLDTSCYTAVPIFQRNDGALFLLPWHFLHRGKISDFEHRLHTEAQSLTWDSLKQLMDFAYIAMHGHYAEDGTMQGMLEVLGIPYLGSKVLASALGMDKSMHKTFLKACGIRVPHGITLTPHDITTYANNHDALIALLHTTGITLPCIVKPALEGSSLGVTIVHTTDTLIPALEHACAIDPFTKQKVLIEEKIEGMEFTCVSMIDYRTGEWIALPPTEIVPEAAHGLYDYEQKYMPGRALKCTPARCSPEITLAITHTCIAASKALGFTTLSRIDGFVTNTGEIVIIDPNTLSGMAPSSYIFNQAAEYGMSHTDFINYLITTELSAYNMLDNAMQTKSLSNTSTTPSRLRVAVLLGGATSEREISLESGRNVVYKLSPHMYDVIPVFVDDATQLYQLTHAQLVRGSTKEIKRMLQETARIAWNDLPNIADFVFIALHGGKGENGSIQGALEMLGLPYNGSGVLASALCMDKYRTTQYLAQQGFDVPRSLLVDQHLWDAHNTVIFNTITRDLGFPCIIKPHDDGCSTMVKKINAAEELSGAIDQFFATGRISVLIEEYINGMELTVGVIGNGTARALPPSKTVVSADILSLEEKFLPGAGENLTPAPLPDVDIHCVQQTMEKVYQAVGCAGYARIDCFFQSAEQSPTGKKRVVVLEINSLPGLTPATCIFHQAAEVGMRPMDFINVIINLGLEHHATHKNNADYCAAPCNDTKPWSTTE